MDTKYLAEIKARTEEAVEDGIGLQQLDDLERMIDEVERQTDQHRCDAHNLEAMRATLNQQAKNCENLLSDDKQQIATLQAEVEHLQKCRDGCKIDCLLEEYSKVVAERNTLKKALLLMGNDLADWMGNGTGEFWAKDYTAQAQGQEGK